MKGGTWRRARELHDLVARCGGRRRPARAPRPCASAEADPSRRGRRSRQARAAAVRAAWRVEKVQQAMSASASRCAQLLWVSTWPSWLAARARQLQVGARLHSLPLSSSRLCRAVGAPFGVATSLSALRAPIQNADRQSVRSSEPEGDRSSTTCRRQAILGARGSPTAASSSIRDTLRPCAARSRLRGQR